MEGEEGCAVNIIGLSGASRVMHTSKMVGMT